MSANCPAPASELPCIWARAAVRLLGPKACAAFKPAVRPKKSKETLVNLSTMLKDRAPAGRPVRIGLVGAGKFGTMFLSQVRLTAGMHLAGLADLMPDRARERLKGAQWAPEQVDAKSI